MTRFILTVSICLLFIVSASAEEQPMSDRELAETQLMAEWVGDPEKQFTLGKVYYEGAGVRQDYAEAAKWFRLAADQGSVESQHMLGVMYDQGDGMPQDFSKAISWYRQAANQGFAPAQYDLGKQYLNGEGVPQNYSEAYVWFSLAASTGLEAARMDRDTVAARLSKEKIAEAQQRAARLFEEIQQGKTAE
jgi:TPR repeat protein